MGEIQGLSELQKSDTCNINHYKQKTILSGIRFIQIAIMPIKLRTL